ncbi:MAG: hypothetical protein QXU20_03740 [Candidatus Woesearchaeota archaeon]
MQRKRVLKMKQALKTSKEIILLAFLILILSGCSTPDSSKDTYYVGRDGVSVKFAQGSPPDVVYDGKPFSIIIDAQNLGAITTSPKVFFVGFEKQILPIQESFDVGTLNGKSNRFPQGERKMLKVGSFTPKLPEGTDLLENIPIKMLVCYSYETKASQKVCIDPDPTLSSSDVCKPQTISLSSGQGAPVGVTSIKTESSIGAAYFEITIKNLGGGTVIKNDKVGSCTQVTFMDTNEIPVSVSLVDKPLSCDPQTVILDSSGSASVYCRLEGLEETGPAYYSQLNIKIGPYGYKKDADTKTLTIRK